MQQIRNELRTNSLVTLVCAVSGTGLLILGLATPGSKIDRTEFCFKPEPIYKTQKVRNYLPNGNYITKVVKVAIPSEKPYCTGEKIYLGVSWKLADSIDKNPELRKIYFKRKLPAKKPLAGWFSLTGSGFLFIAWLIWNQGTELYFQNLQRILKLKELELVEGSLSHESEVTLLSNKYKNQTEYYTEVQDRHHGSKLAELIEENESKYKQLQASKLREVTDLQHILQKAAIKAETATLQEKEAKALLEVQKASSKLDDPWQEDTSDTSLKKLLQEHEGGWMWDITQSITPLIIYGRSGSYKSYTASCFVLLKHHFLGASLESIADPQWHQNREKAWSEIIHLKPHEYGEESNWDDAESSYEEGILALLERCKHRTESDNPIISVWDELTKLGIYLPETSKSFMPEVISSPRKANEHIILLTHNITQKGLGNVENLSEAIKEGTFRLKMRGNNLQQPLFQGVLNGWIGSEGEVIEDMPVSIPDWFRPEKLKEMM